MMWGNQASVLVGDFLYSRSFQLMVELERLPVMQILADTTNQIAEGEVLQLLNMLRGPRYFNTDVALLKMEGCTNLEIAERLQRTDRTDYQATSDPAPAPRPGPTGMSCFFTNPNTSV